MSDFSSEVRRFSSTVDTATFLLLYLIAKATASTTTSKTKIDSTIPVVFGADEVVCSVSVDTASTGGVPVFCVPVVKSSTVSEPVDVFEEPNVGWLVAAPCFAWSFVIRTPVLGIPAVASLTVGVPVVVLKETKVGGPVA